MEQRNLSIGLLRTPRTKGLLRGLLNRGEGRSYKKTLNNLRATTSSEDLEIVAQLLVFSPLFAHVEFPNVFPSEPPVAIGAERLELQSLNGELIFQCLRINKHADRLLSAIDDLWALNEAILSRDALRAVDLIRQFVSHYGYSNVILHKLAYILAEFGDQPTIDQFCRAELEKFGLLRRFPIALASVDMMNDEYSFVTLRRNLFDFIDPIRSPTSRDIVDYQFRPIRFERADLSNQLQSHGLFSLLDVTFFILLHYVNVDIFQSLSVGDVVSKWVPTALIERWRTHAASCCPAERYTVSSMAEFDDLTFYRRSLAFIEYQTVAAFRNGIDPYYIDNKTTPLVRNARSVDFCTKYFASVRSLSTIAAEPNEVRLQLDRYVNSNAGIFLRTIAFVHLLRGGAKRTDISAQQVLTLMNNTTNIADIAQSSELRNFFELPTADMLANYLAQAVIFDCSKQNSDQHKLRRALQDIVLKRFGGDIIAFADTLWASSKYVAAHLFETCTEAFLVQLFFLFPEPDMVFEARAQLLDWFAKRFGDSAAAERAKALRLDQKLRKIRGEIDDARIYVDHFRFGQWLLDNRIERLGGLSQIDKIDRSKIDEFHAFEDYVTNRQPHVQTAIALQNAFTEFCVDKRYGVDSYLGRRIRHGTLKGVMLVQLQSIMQKPKYQSLLSEPSVRAHVQAWFRRYERSVDYWGAEVFQIASKQKPRGAISTDITSPDKIELSRAFLREAASVTKETKNPLQIDQIIFEYCWQLVEKDLQAIRYFIHAERIRWGTIDRAELHRLISDQNYSLGIEFCREINLLTDEKFSTLARWFTRPTILAPSASVQLLLDATLEEVKGHFPDYSPRIERRGSDVQLIGMYYHHLYDFLYVVIYNAAKHGKRNGRLVEEITLGGRRLEIAIASEIKQGDKIETIRETIRNSMSGDIENAMVVEGQSGLKKLLRMSSDVKQIKDIQISYPDGLVRFNCIVELDFIR